MMNLFGWVLGNRLHYKGETMIVGSICGFLMFVATASVLLMQHIASQTQKPLEALNTELILQQSSDEATPSGLKTGGLITPFEMQSFSGNRVENQLDRLDYIKAHAAALILWKLDVRGTLVIAGIKTDDPLVGLRNIESMLIKGRFFSSDHAEEVILERHFATFFSHKLGGFFPIQDRNLKIVGIVDFVDQSNLNTASVFLPYQTAVELAGALAGSVNQMFVSLDDATETKRFIRDAQTLMPGFSIITRDSLYKNLKGISGIMHRFGNAVILLLWIIGFVLIGILLKIHTHDFKQHNETLRMIGWPSGFLRSWMLLDVAVILIVAFIFCTVLVAFFLAAGLPAIHLSTPSLQELVV